MTPEKIKSQIVKLISIDTTVTYNTLEQKAVAKGIDMNLFLQAVTLLHNDKRIKRNVKAGEIVYEVAKTKPTALSHTQWIKSNYPPMTPDNDGSGIEIDMSWLFLKTKEERDAFKAEMSGRPVYLKSKYAKK